MGLRKGGGSLNHWPTYIYLGHHVELPRFKPSGSDINLQGQAWLVLVQIFLAHIDGLLTTVSPRGGWVPRLLVGRRRRKLCLTEPVTGRRFCVAKSSVPAGYTFAGRLTVLQ